MKETQTRIKELIAEYKKATNGTDEDIAKSIGLNSTANISRWASGKVLPSVKYSLKLAKLFDCTLDYLFGRTNTMDSFKNLKTVDFAIHLQELLNERKITKYKLFKDLNLTKGHETSWFKQKRTPTTANYLRLADYLNISVDELVGRV